MKRKRLRTRLQGQRMIIERYYCGNGCGQCSGIMRKPAARRAPGHAKTIYCPRCRAYTQHEKRA